MAESSSEVVEEHGFRPLDPFVVGIGASAGGLEACSALLKNLPSDTGLAFVVVQHLDPRRESLLPALLGRITTFPVKAVEDEMAIEANCVYVMPANKEIVIEGGVLRLLPRPERPKDVFLPIDAFFRSLAESRGSRAIGVVLSGTGTDGALGLEAIKAAGGITFSQDASSAKFAGMPHSAFATGAVDFVLPPEGIAQELIRISRNNYVEEPSLAASDEETQTREPFKGILNFLQGAAGVDFTEYRVSTIARRVLRRMAINRFSDAEAYRQYLAKTPVEVELLCEEMIPRVTRFFRDPKAFETLQSEVFPQFLKDRANDEAIRIWVPGCASGEEAYAIAICLLEFLNKKEAVFPVQIFGTDLSSTAIQMARKGLYDLKIAEDVSRERLERFFVKHSTGYQIGREVRETCIYASHDLVRDPPYSRLDLISCRNVLIYLDGVQKRIIPMFHHALNATGFLMLGVAETARKFSDLFVLMDRHSQIYSKRPVARKEARDWGPMPSAGRSTARRKPQQPWDVAELQKHADRAISTKYGPSGVVVNENWQILQVRGQVNAFLEPAPGKMSVNVITIAKRSGLSLELSAALEEARSTGTAVRRERVALLPGKDSVNLQIIPLGRRGENDRLYLVLFEPIPEKQIDGPADIAEGSDDSNSELLGLQLELNATRERLATILDVHQAYTDETQSAQEESLSNMEDMQTFNEELETAKEELQSTNEELSTVNDELQSRNNELQQARDFATAVVDAVREAQVVLDKNSLVKMANLAFYETFGLRAHDTEGRVFFDLAERAWDVSALRSAIKTGGTEESVFTDLEVEVGFPKAGRRLLRISGRRLKDDEMILLAMDDITARRQGEIELERVKEDARQGQKMEAIGRLAGGIAHDFNNLLTVILGFSQMLMASLSEGTQAHHRAQEINKAGDRAASLTHQLLAFSRRQVLQPQSLQLNNVILDMEKMLRRLIGDNIALEKALEKELGVVHADPGQMGQVILNLALNARDAMPNGGVLTIRTSNTTVRKKKAERLRDLAPGRYVTLSIADSGDGMDQETQKHIFEPFYTTKEQGLGTGLGLATVSGIVQQSGGNVGFVSELHRGTTFWVDLPRVEARSAYESPRSTGEIPQGDETILVVEDEQLVRGLAVEILEQLGYAVLKAAEADEGLEVCRTHPAPIHLLVTDVLMPGTMSGRQLAEQAIAMRPTMRVLMVSGYTTDALVQYGIEKGAAFLHKPFTVEQLGCKVRDVLDAEDTAGFSEDAKGAGS